MSKTNEKNSRKKILEINAVEGFDPTSLTVKIQDENGEEREHLLVKDRVSWFMLKHPKGTIETAPYPVTNMGNMVVEIAKVFDGEGHLLATGTGSAIYHENDSFGKSPFECAETKAIGRALANAGFGTQQGADFDLPPKTVIDMGVPSSEDSKKSENLLDDTKESKKSDLEDKVERIMKTLTPALSKGILISYGPAQNLTISDVYKNEKDEDKLATIKKYAFPEKSEADENHASVIAACRVFINGIEDAAKAKK